VTLIDWNTRRRPVSPRDVARALDRCVGKRECGVVAYPGRAQNSRNGQAPTLRDEHPLRLRSASRALSLPNLPVSR